MTLDTTCDWRQIGLGCVFVISRDSWYVLLQVGPLDIMLTVGRDRRGSDTN